MSLGASDQAIWAVWYDLAEPDRPGFLSWLHATCLPGLEALPAFSWVAHYEQQEAPPQSERKPDGTLMIGHTDEMIGDGQQFLLLVAAASPRVFLDPLFLTAETGLVAGAGEKLALRRGTRHALFIEQQRVTGSAPAAAAHPPYPAPAIQFGSFRMQSYEDEYELAAFYEQSRLPLMAASAQCIRTRKLVSVAGWAKHGVIYEFTSLAARNECWAAARRARAAGDPAHAWVISDKTLHSPGSPVVATRTWPALR